MAAKSSKRGRLAGMRRQRSRGRSSSEGHSAVQPSKCHAAVQPSAPQVGAGRRLTFIKRNPPEAGLSHGSVQRILQIHNLLTRDDNSKPAKRPKPDSKQSSTPKPRSPSPRKESKPSKDQDSAAAKKGECHSAAANKDQDWKKDQE